jgi:hypothetical protein
MLKCGLIVGVQNAPLSKKWAIKVWDGSRACGGIGPSCKWYGQCIDNWAFPGALFFSSMQLAMNIKSMVVQGCHCCKSPQVVACWKCLSWANWKIWECFSVVEVLARGFCFASGDGKFEGKPSFSWWGCSMPTWQHWSSPLSTWWAWKAHLPTSIYVAHMEHIWYTRCDDIGRG